MADKFQNKYRIPQARAPWWNYGDDGNYFFTINTYNKNHWFGEIVEGEMRLSEVGEIVEEEWLKTKAMRPDMNLDISCYVIMPNHFHAIICIGENEYNKQKTVGIHLETQCFASHKSSQTNVHNVKTQCFAFQKLTQIDSMFSEMHGSASLQAKTDTAINETQSIATLQVPTDTNNQFGPQSHNLASIIRGFKSGVTKNARKFIPLFAWQTRYHDHIIRSTDEFIRISHYICTNVEHWEEDCFYQNGMRI